MLNLIWDLDGTMIDSEIEIKDSLVRSLKENGLDEKDSIKPLRIGPTIFEILSTSFSADKMPEEKLDAVAKSFRKNYDNSDFSQTYSFCGIEEIIYDTKNFTHYVITNKPDLPSKKILKKLGFEHCIKRVATPYTFTTEKRLSKAALFSRLIDEEKLDKTKTYGIGDMQGDEVAAHSAGIKAIGVLWGTGTRKELTACDWIVQNCRELKNLVSAI